MRRPTSWTLLILILATSTSRAVDDPDPREAARKDLARLQGAWTLVEMESGGHALDMKNFEGWGSVYEHDRLTLKAKDQVRRRGIVSIDPTRTPKATNTWDLDGPYQDQTVPGIYELEGDTLKLCFARPGEKRPTEFTTKSGTGFLFVVYKRVKP